MSSGTVAGTPRWSLENKEGAKPPQGLRRSEDLSVSLALAAMVILPLAEIVLRTSLGIGISGANSLIQHLTLIVGMLGGAVAAREDRLLALSTGVSFLRGPLKSAAGLLGGSCAAVICVS